MLVPITNLEAIFWCGLFFGMGFLSGWLIWAPI